MAIMNHNVPRVSWLTENITKTYHDKRGLVRSVQLRTKTGYLERPVTKPCMLLEAQELVVKTRSQLDYVLVSPSQKKILTHMYVHLLAPFLMILK